MTLSERLKRAQASAKARQDVAVDEVDYATMAAKSAIELQVDNVSAAETYSKMRKNTSLSDRLSRVKSAGQTDQTVRISVDDMFSSLGLNDRESESEEATQSSQIASGFSLGRARDSTASTSSNQEKSTLAYIFEKEPDIPAHKIDKKKGAIAQKAAQPFVNTGMNIANQTQNDTMGGSTMRRDPLGAGRSAVTSARRRRPRLGGLAQVQTSGATTLPTTAPAEPVKPEEPVVTMPTVESTVPAEPAMTVVEELKQEPAEMVEELKQETAEEPTPVKPVKVEQTHPMELQTVKKVESTTEGGDVGIIELGVMAKACNVSERDLVNFAVKAYTYAIKHGRLKTASKQIGGLAYYTHFITPQNPPTVVVTLTYSEYAAVIEVDVDDSGYTDLAHKLEVADGIAKVYGIPAALLDCRNKALRAI